jgi:5-methylcytosine-specific restriction endonuclease McrA
MDNTIPQDNAPRKQCTGKCKQFLPATSEFFYCSKQRLNSECKTCNNARRRQYDKEHREEVKHRRHEQYLNNREKVKRDQEIYRQSHKSGFQRRNKKYYETHRNEILNRAREMAQQEPRKGYYREYIKANKEKRKVNDRLRQARKKAIPGKHTAQDIQSQYERQKGHCYWCSTKLGKGKNAYHVDHIIPLSREGSSNDPSNLVIACPSCNTSRNNKLPHEWPEGGRLL